jgi:hypothetical protein
MVQLFQDGNIGGFFTNPGREQKSATQAVLMSHLKFRPPPPLLETGKSNVYLNQQETRNANGDGVKQFYWSESHGEWQAGLEDAYTVPEQISKSSISQNVQVNLGSIPSFCKNIKTTLLFRKYL